MKNLLFAAMLIAAPASAQVATDSVEAAAAKARSWREKLAPAPVDKEQVKALADKLMKDGEQMESEVGLENVLGDVRERIVRGKNKVVGIEASLSEIPAELVEDQEAPIRFALLTRYFSHITVTREEWAVDSAGRGRVEVWSYRLSLDGMLQSVEKTRLKVAPGPDGEIAPDLDSAKSWRMSPSDPSVQKRWKKTAKELVFLGRRIEV